MLPLKYFVSLVINNMNNPDIKNFLTSIERAAEGKSDLALRSQRPALCPHLSDVKRLLKQNVPEEQRVNFTASFTRKETMCIAGQMIFTFTFDDVPEFTSRNSKPLISKYIDSGEKQGLHGIANNYMRHNEERSWPKYDAYVKSRIEQLTDPEEELGYYPENFEKLDTLVGESDVDEHNVRIRRDLSLSFSGGDEDLMEHLNLNAHFFKRLFEMGMPGRDVNHQRDYRCGSFREGLVSARAITIGMFLDCAESSSSRGGNHRRAYDSPRVHIKKEIPQPGVRDSDYTITRAGFLCRGVDGSPFVLVGCHGTGYHKLFYSIENRITLATPFGPGMPQNLKRVFPFQTEVNADEERRVNNFVEGASNSHVFIPTRESTLSRRASDVMVEDMLSLGNKYETMRCIWPRNKAKSRLVVISGRDVFVMSKQSHSKMIEDFPRYGSDEDSGSSDMDDDSSGEKDPTMPPTNENGTYYKIDQAVSPEFVAAAVDYCGFVRGRKVQPIKFIKPNGDVSTILVDFAFAFDDAA